MSPRSALLALALLCGCERPNVEDDVTWTRNNRVIIELNNPPEGVRCFVVINKSGIHPDTLSCVPVKP